MKLIAYYRTSTKEQNLGIEVQRKAVEAFCLSNGYEILATFHEQESGKNANRSELRKAIVECKKHNCKLIVSQLDRLTRKLKHLVLLRENKVQFICADSPNANDFEINIKVAFAEEELRKISERTKSALGILKGQGVKLGNSSKMKTGVREMGRAAWSLKSRTNEESIKAAEVARLMREAGSTFSYIADRLNAKKFTTPRGGQFSAKQVYNLINLIKS